MKSIALLAIMLALGAAFAGCLGGDDVAREDDADTSLATDGGAAENNTTAQDTEPATVNTAPTAELTADVVDGEAPLLVTFTISAADADGDGLNWTLDADGDGEADSSGDSGSAEYAHNYTVAGNYSAVLNLTDGTDSIEAVLNITVAEAGPPAVVPEDMEFGGTIVLGVQHPVEGTYEGLGNPVQRPFDFTDNRSAVSKMTLDLSVSAGGVDTELALIAPDGTEVAADPSTITVEDPALIQLEGEWTAQVRVNAGARVEYTITVTFE